MLRGGRPVLLFTLCWALAGVLATGTAWFVRGGEDGAAARRGFVGVLGPRLDPGPAAAVPAPVLPPDDATGGAPTPTGVAAALRSRLADPRLGGRPAITVLDAEDGRALFTRSPDAPVSPASTTKIVTATAVLAAFGPYHRFRTTVVAGATPGEVVLVGGGDPTLALGAAASYPGASRLDLLASRVRTALGRAPSAVTVDASLFAGPATAPGWDTDIVSGGYGAPVSALTVDGGRTRPTPDHRTARTPTPALFAGRAFARLAGAPSAPVTEGTAPTGGRTIATLDSPPLLHLVELMLRESDNVIAEALVRQVAVAKRQPATFTGAMAAVRTTLDGLGVQTEGDVLVDGSGLSRRNRLTTTFLTRVLAAVTGPDHPELRGVLSGMPVAAYSGTLAERFGQSSASAAGTVRAKTGTLSGVSALSGVVVTASGRVLAFAAVANGVPAGGTLGAEAALDRIAAALAGCGCAA